MSSSCEVGVQDTFLLGAELFVAGTKVRCWLHSWVQQAFCSFYTQPIAGTVTEP